MGYELRRGGRYYYTACRVDGRVVKTYMGNGVAAQRAAAEVAASKQDRLDRRRRDLEFAQQLMLLSKDFDQFWLASERILNLAFVAGNYHRHRGEWRRRRAQ